MSETKHKEVRKIIIPTNDFDLKPEKKPPLSTVKAQEKNIRKIKETIDFLKNSNLMLNFDRLKICIDLHKFGKEINFVLKEMKKTAYSDLLPNERYVKEHITKNFTNIQEEEIDEEIINDDKRKKIYPNCTIPYEIYKKTIGINNVYIKNDILIIDITGKFMADYGFLGLLNKKNIKEAIQKLKKLNLFSFNTDIFLKHAGCFLCDVTLDLLFPKEEQIKRTINAISSFMPIISERYNISKYKSQGLLIKKNIQDPGYSMVFYCKGEEIYKKIDGYTKVTKPVIYTETIGDLGEKIAMNTLRIEMHLYKLAIIRLLLGITHKTKGFISLQDVLNSNTPVFLNAILKSGININKLYESLEWYEFKANPIFDDEHLNENDIKDLLVKERLASLLIENNYNINMLRAHLITEYNIDIESKFAKDLMTIIKNDLYDYLCYRKPKSVTWVLLLIQLIIGQYCENAGYEIE